MEEGGEVKSLVELANGKLECFSASCTQDSTLQQERFNVVRHDICPLPAHVYETLYYCTCTPDAAHCLGYARAYFVVISLRNAATYGRRVGR